MKKANCFENAARFIIDAAIDDPKADLTLVHCTVIGAGDKVKGQRYCHAFVIEKKPMLSGHHVIELAIDNALDFNNPTIIPLEYYRAMGQVSNESHYCVGEVRALLQIHENYGPWDDELQTDFDRACK